MKTIDATPQADLPRQVIVMDREIAKRHPDKGFYLRVCNDGSNVEIVELDGEMTLPGAVKAAHQKGYEPTHWMETTAGHASRIPDSVRPS